MRRKYIANVKAVGKFVDEIDPKSRSNGLAFQSFRRSIWWNWIQESFVFEIDLELHLFHANTKAQIKSPRFLKLKKDAF